MAGSGLREGRRPLIYLPAEATESVFSRVASKLTHSRPAWRNYALGVIRATLYTDPACPWGYSANPALRVLEWWYGDQIEWRLVTIGLRDEVTEAAAQSWDRAAAAARGATFRDRYGMPYALVPKERAASTGRGCRAVVAARLIEPGLEWDVLRALHLANFTTTLLLDDDDLIRDALAAAGLDADAIVGRLDDPDVTEAYERDKAEARTAAGTAAETQGKTSTSDGPVRYTAPSVVFEQGDRRLVAGGWQPLLAYDVLIANLDPSLVRTPPPETPEPLLDRFHRGLTTAEVAALLAQGPDYVVDQEEAERLLLELVSTGAATRAPLGHDALWASRSVSDQPPPQRAAAAVA
jgi:predicted DsbA family dithiol-disulfide isomerase